MSEHDTSTTAHRPRKRIVISSSEATPERLEAEPRTSIRLSLAQAEQLRRIEAEAEGARAVAAARSGERD